MSDLVKFNEYKEGAANNEKKVLDEEGGDILKLAAGKNRIRIMPPLGEMESPFVVTYQHFLKGPNGMRGVNCPRMMTKKPCAVCNYSQRLKASRSKADQDMGWQFAPKRRVYASVINRKQPESGPKLLAFGKMIHEALVSLRLDSDWGEFSHPVDGYDVTIEKEGEGMKTEYRVTPNKHSALAATDEQMNEWLDMPPDFSRYIHIPSQSELAETLEAVGLDFGDEAPQQVLAAPPRPAPRAITSAKKNTTRSVEDDLADDDDAPPF